MSKRRRSKQGWTNEFSTNKFEECLDIISKPRSLAGVLENGDINWFYEEKPMQFAEAMEINDFKAS